MKKIGIVILGIVVLALILVLTLVMEVLEFFAGIALFFVAVGILIYMYRKIKEKVT